MKFFPSTFEENNKYITVQDAKKMNVFATILNKSSVKNQLLPLPVLTIKLE